MKVMIEIRDDKAKFFIELMNSLPFVKYKPLSPTKAKFMEELRDAVEAINSVKSGKSKARPLQNLLDEL